MNQIEILNFIKSYEIATNSHEKEKIKDFIASDAIYFFSDEKLYWIDEIIESILKTWKKIKNEVYKISDIIILHTDEKSASFSYTFNWSWEIKWKIKSWTGRWTNIIKKNNWKVQIIHEHLSI